MTLRRNGFLADRYQIVVIDVGNMRLHLPRRQKSAFPAAFKRISLASAKRLAMKRTDRMFAIVVDLQARKIQRAEDLATRYETSVRTIYRDVTALCEAGIPVIALPGQGYTLPPDFFLPPLSLALEEAAALLLGSDYVQQTLDPAYAAAAIAAGKKIAAIVPAALREPLDEARRAMRLVGGSSGPDELARLTILRKAIADRRVLTARYRGRRTADAAGTGELPRRIAPYGLAHMRGIWYVVGFSYERDAIRNFRLSRIDELTVTAESFVLPPGFELGPPPPERQLPLLVRIAFAGSELGIMHERLRPFEATIEPSGDEFVAAFRTHSDVALVSYVLGWGSRVRVIEPLSLREHVVAEARRISEVRY